MAKARLFEKPSIWNQIYKNQDFECFWILNGQISDPTVSLTRFNYELKNYRNNISYLRTFLTILPYVWNIETSGGNVCCD